MFEYSNVMAFGKANATIMPSFVFCFFFNAEIYFHNSDEHIIIMELFMNFEHHNSKGNLRIEIDIHSSDVFIPLAHLNSKTNCRI